MRNALRSLHLSLELLLGRRLVLFAAIDLLVVGMSVLMMLLESNGDAGEIYRSVFLFPALVLALPALSGLVDLERRAGCLDLALSAPSAEGYFVRRAAAVCAVVALQGELILLFGWVLWDFSFPLLPVVLQVLAASVFLGTVALFWAVRLRTSGAVWLASAVTVGLMAKWFFFNPASQEFGTLYGSFLPRAEDTLPWLRSFAVLTGGSALFFLYARRRLRRPELMIS